MSAEIEGSNPAEGTDIRHFVCVCVCVCVYIYIYTHIYIIACDIGPQNEVA